MPLKISCRADDSDKHELDINHLLFHEGTLYSAGDDGKIKAWTPGLKKKSEVQAHQCSVYCLAASHDSLYSCSNDGTIKSWELDTLKGKSIIVQDEQTEFWRITFYDDCLYSGDDKGYIRVFKNNKFYGALNIAEPIKDMAMSRGMLFTVKDLDLVVTHIKPEGKKIQYGTKKSFMGRAPVTLVGDNLFAFITREGKEILLHENNDESHFKQTARITDAHDLIINGLCGVNWDGQEFIFSAGWDKMLKRWKIKNNGALKDENINLDFVVNVLKSGEKGQIFVGGADGHIIRVDSS